MDEFPPLLQHGDIALELDRRRLVMACADAAVADDLVPILAAVSLEPDVVEGELPASAGLMWLRSADATPLDQVRLDALTQTASGLLAWLAPVYRETGLDGGELYCPRPNSLVARSLDIHPADDEMTALLGSRGYEEVPGISEYLDGYRYFRRPLEAGLPACIELEQVRVEGDGVIEDLRLEYLLGSAVFAGPREYTPTPQNPKPQANLRYSRILEAQRLLGTAVLTPIAVAIIDSGVALDHPDLRLGSRGTDATNDQSDGSPTKVGNIYETHGTQLAGIVGMVADNGIGGWGITPDVFIESVAMAKGGLSDEVLAAAIGKAAACAEVLNLSMEIMGSAGLRACRHANAQIVKAYNAGRVICASAGNRQLGEVAYPACHPLVIACTALNNDHPPDDWEVWPKANFGQEISVAAPSRMFWTTSFDVLPTQHTYAFVIEGQTSFATAVVSGVAALLLKRYPDLRPDQVRAIIERTAIKCGVQNYDGDLPNGLHNYTLGFGALNAFRAMDFADVSIRHHGQDDGSEPTPAQFNVLDECDVVISPIALQDPRLAFSRKPGKDSGDIVPGAPAYLYVRVSNGGPATARNVRVRACVVPQSDMPYTYAHFRSELLRVQPATPVLAFLAAGSRAVLRFNISPGLSDLIIARTRAGQPMSVLAEVLADNDYAHETSNLKGTDLERRRNNLARRDIRLAPAILEGEPREENGRGQKAPTEAEISRVHIFRATDMLDLDVELVNLKAVTTDGERRLVRRNADEEAYVIVHFAPQAICEAAYFEGPARADDFVPVGQQTLTPTGGAAEPPPSTPVPRRMASRSRLAFRVRDSLPLTTQGLLDWLALEPSIAARAVSPQAAGEHRPTEAIAPPTRMQTALSVPYRLVLSPNEHGAWHHESVPVTHGARTELWHTRLGVRRDGHVDLAATQHRSVRAIWSPDYRSRPGPKPSDTKPFRSSLSPDDRHQIVRLSSDFGIRARSPNPLIPFTQMYEPQPIEADRLMLTALGAWADLRGSWELRNSAREREGLSVEAWEHTATQGRDHFSRVTYAGFLWPTCHRAALIKTTERKVQIIGGIPVAVLRQRFNVEVRQPERSYAGNAYAHDGRENPFLSGVRIHALTTPDLALPDPVPGTGTFWIADARGPFRFPCTGIDATGHPVDFQMGAMFVPIDDLPGNVSAIAAAYAQAPESWRSSQVGGRKMGMAPPLSPGQTEGTQLETDSFVLTAKGSLINDESTRFVPYLVDARVRLPVVEQMVGTLGSQQIALGDAYLQGTANAAGLFARVLSTPGMQVPAERAGALATPNLTITGLSDRLGPLGGVPADLEQGTLDPLSFFDASAKLLGGVELGKLIAPLFQDTQIPAMQTGLRVENGKQYGVTTLRFAPSLHPFGPFQFRAGAPAALVIESELWRQLDSAAGGAGEQRLRGTLSNFRMDLAGVLSVDFDALEFRRIGSEPMQVTPTLPDDAITFTGPLEFVNELRKAIPKNVFGGGLSIDVQPKGVTAGYSLALPKVEVGVLAIKDASLSVSLFLPFLQDQARLRFSFCERHRPFQLVVALFGGGGFLSIGVGMDGVETVEAALEFGGAFSLNLGVASGGVEVMAGIYFKWESQAGQDRVTLAGYVRMGGMVQVLGIITISVSFYLGLSYQSDGKVRGQATLTVKVEVLMFSTSVNLTVEHSFSGSAGDPTFGQLVDQSDWNEYAQAFA